MTNTKIANISLGAGAGKINGFLSNVSIRAKILAGFGVVVLLLGVVAGFGYFSLKTIGHEVDELIEVIHEASLVSKIETEFLKLKTHAREFANLGREEDAKEVKTLTEKLNPLIATALKSLKHQPQMHKKMVDLNHEFDIYIKDFHQAETLRHEFQKLILERLEPEGEKIVEDLDVIIKGAAREGNRDAMTYASTAREHALKARLYTNILIGRQDNSFGPKVEHEFAEFQTALDALGKAVRSEQEKKLHAETQQLLNDYKVTFEKIHKDELELRTLVDHGMREAGAKIAEDAEWIEAEAGKIEQNIKTEVDENIAYAEIEMVIIGLAGLAAGLLIAFLLGAGIARPVISMTSAMGRLADGDLEAEIPAQGRGDEIGRMASAVQVFKDSAIRNRELEAGQEAAKLRAEEEKKAMMNDLADSFESSVGNVIEGVASAATEMRASSESMSAIADQTKSQSMSVASGSEEASTNVQTVASASEELASSISEISRQVTQSAEIAQRAVARAEETDEQIQGLAETANKIGDVVNMITAIAEQTNLLALNATIEAARAGEAGKGFAVVAGEVKELASQTAKATDEISAQIGSIQGATDSAVGAVKDIRQIIGEMDEIGSAIAAAVEEQGSATQEIARNIEQAALGTQDVSSNIAMVTQAAGETGEAAVDMMSASGELSEQSEMLKREVGKFLTSVRAA